MQETSATAPASAVTDEPGYLCAHIRTVLDICGTSTEQRPAALVTAAADIVRQATISNGGRTTFAERMGKLVCTGGALCAVVPGKFDMPVVFAVEMWRLLRVLAVLSPTAASYIPGRTDKQALCDFSNLMFVSASGTGGRPPFGSITASDPAVNFAVSLRSAERLWSEFMAGPARCFIGQIPAELVRPTFDAALVADFVEGRRATLLSPVGRPGRVFQRALVQAMGRRYVHRRHAFDGDLLRLLYNCCRHELPAKNSVGAAGVPVDDESFDGHLIVSALAGAVDRSETSGKKQKIALGCPATLRVMYADGAPLCLLVHGEGLHNHDRDSDDVHLPLAPGVLNYIHSNLVKRREANIYK